MLTKYDKYWKDKMASTQSRTTDMPTGVECPKCKEAEVRANKQLVLTSNPPQYKAWCPDAECGWTGYV